MTRKHFSFIFLGDTHGFMNDLLIQKETIKKFQPDYVLSESLQNLRFSRNKSTDKKIETLEPASKNLTSYCIKKNIEIIGIDYKNFGLSKKILNSLQKNEKLSSSHKQDIKNILKKRTERHLKFIRKFEKSLKPVVVVIGAYHLRPKSPILKSVKNALVIQPCDEKNNLVYEPTQKKLKYCARVI